MRWPVPWFYFTRGFGIAMIVFGLLFDDTGDRGTIILTGAGIAGFDKVARSDSGGKGS